jgi:hypothetical protein
MMGNVVQSPFLVQDIVDVLRQLPPAPFSRNTVEDVPNFMRTKQERRYKKYRATYRRLLLIFNREWELQ